MPDGPYRGVPAKPPYNKHDHAKSNDVLATAWEVEPDYKIVRDAAIKRHSLLWNPYMGFGVPLLGDIQTQIFNPLCWLARLPSPSPLSVICFPLANLFCAGMLMFVFLRLFLKPSACMLGAVAYTFTGYFMLYLCMPDQTACALLPGLFWSLECLLRKPGFSNTFMVAFFSAFTLLACGLPEMSFVCLVSGSAYFAFRALAGRRELFARRLACYSLGSLIGCMLAAPFVLPFLEYMKESFNAHLRDTNVLAAGKEFIPFVPENIITYLSPYAFVPLLRCSDTLIPDDNFKGFIGFWGISVFFLAACGIVQAIKGILAKSRRRYQKAELLAIFSFAGWLILIAKRFGCPALQWLGDLPLFNLVLFWKYPEIVMGFFVAVLAALGFAWLSDRTLERPLLSRTFIGVALIYAALLVLSFPLVVPTYRIYYLALAAFTLIILIASYRFALQALSLKESHSKALIKLFALTTFELMLNFAGPNLVLDISPLRQYNPFAGAPYVSFLEQLDSNQKHERIFAQDGLLMGRWGSAFALFDSRNYGAIYPKRYFPFVQAFVYGKQISADPGFWTPCGLRICPPLTETCYGSEEEIDPFFFTENAPMILRFWQLASARYIVRDITHPTAFPPELGQSADCFQAPIYQHDANIFMLSKVLPRAALYSGATAENSDQDVLHRLVDRKFDPFRQAVLEKGEFAETDQAKLKLLTDNSNPEPVEEQTITSYRPEEVEIAVDAKKAGLLVLNDTFYPGWLAFVDGREVKIHHANYLFRSILVEPGKHVVIFKYQPTSFFLGIALLVLGLIVLAGWKLAKDRGACL
jgi:hypothetical protein